MASRLKRRTAPHVIMNNHSQQPSVSNSTQPANQEQINKTENGNQTIATDTPLQKPPNTPNGFIRTMQV